VGIKPEHLARLIREVLAAVDLYSDAALALLLGTAAQESRMGYYLYQMSGGPALGIYQMEPVTESDLWDHYLAYRDNLRRRVVRVTGRTGPGPWLASDLAYQTVMTRIHYLRVPSPLPAHDDLPGLADYWKRHYNTYRGAGRPSEFIHNFPA
jgi:hypothetical protein